MIPRGESATYQRTVHAEGLGHLVLSPFFPNCVRWDWNYLNLELIARVQLKAAGKDKRWPRRLLFNKTLIFMGRHWLGPFN